MTPESEAGPVTVRIRRPAPILVTALLVAAAFVLYAPAVFVLPVGDDWQYIAMAEQHGLNVFYDLRHFRLWERAVNAMSIHLLDSYGPVTIALSLGVFAATAALLFVIARDVAPAQRWAPMLAAGFYLFHPANASTVIQMDTLAQSLAGLLTLVTVRYLVFEAPRAALRRDIVGFLLVLCTLLAKETALGCIAWLPVAAWARARWLDRSSEIVAIRQGLRTLWLAGGGIVAYLMLRAALGVELPSYATERYSVHWDVSLWAKNVAQLVGASFYYGDTATLLIFGLIPKVWLSAGLSIVLAAAAGAGAYRMVARPAIGETEHGTVVRLGLWLTFLAASLGPVFLLGSVSELYAAALTPFAALALGVLLSVDATGRVRSSAVAVLVASAFTWGGLSLQGKLVLHKDVSNRTWALLRELAPMKESCRMPLQVRGDVKGTTSGGRPYSVYSASDGQLLKMVLASQRHEPTAAALARLLADAGDRLPRQDAAPCKLELRPDRECLLVCRGGEV